MGRKEPTAPPADRNPGETSGMDQLPPPYQEYPSGYHPPPGVYPPHQSGYPQGQLYGAPYGPPSEGQVQHLYMGPQIVTVEPTVFVPSGVKPQPDHLCYSIFTMLCCCLPLGIIALIFSIKTRDANLMGNYELARKTSLRASLLNSIALVIGLIAVAVCLIRIFSLSSLLVN